MRGYYVGTMIGYDGKRKTHLIATHYQSLSSLVKLITEMYILKHKLKK